jgi:hypothetical protein
MHLGPGIREVVGLDLAQQHRARDPYGVRQFSCFGLGQLEKGPADSPSLGITVSPSPVFEKLPSTFHAPLIDTTAGDLRQARDGQRDLSRGHMGCSQSEGVRQ